MIETRQGSENDAVPSAIVWAIGVFFVLLISMTILPIFTDKKVPKNYNQEHIGQYVTLIGDSISVWSKAELEEALPGIEIDAKGGTWFSMDRKKAGASGMTRLKNHAMRDVVVFLLGTNGGVTEQDIDDLNTYVGKNHKIVIMTIYREKSKMAEWNAIMTKAAERRNVYLLDWYSMNRADPDKLLVTDHVHPNQTGREVFAEAVKKQVLEALDIKQ